MVLACGVFGNVTNEDVQNTIAALPTLCAPGATVLWTRHRFPPDLTVEIRGWFDASGFEELGFVGPREHLFGVGAHRLVVPPRSPAADHRLFTFVDLDELARRVPRPQ